eukprot:jgi/Ulvmu1/5116/UM021_0133.1
MHCAGDLCDPGADAPEVQQLSVWLEYNRVVRRRLVWEAATMLGCCRPGGSALLRLPDLLTTFTVGVLSVLHRCFRHFMLVKPFTSCMAAAESFALFVDCVAQPEVEEGELTPLEHLLMVLERMQDVEAVVECGEGSKRPDEHLLVSRHIPDVVPPEVYLGSDTQFVAYLQGRANELGKRQARLLDQLTKEDVSARPSATEIEAEISTAINVLFSPPTQASQAMERPEILQEEDDVKVLSAVHVAEPKHPARSDGLLPTPSGKRSPDSAPENTLGAVSVHRIHASLDDRLVAATAPVTGNVAEADQPPGAGNAGMQLHTEASMKTEDFPGLRKKRSIQRDRHDSLKTIGSSASKFMCQQEDARGSTAVTSNAQGDLGAHASSHDTKHPNGAVPNSTSSPHSFLVERLSSMHKSGIRVSSDDAFIGWSRHIRQCDEKEKAEDHANSRTDVI